MKNVSKKLLMAIKQVGGGVKKTGYNKFSNYAYITESDVNEAILPALLDNGLIITTSVDSVEETPSGPDSKNRFATVNLIHQIIDVDNGESITLKSAGTAADSLDKSIFKAITGSCKYFYLKLFMISGDDSDPENDRLEPAKGSPPKIDAKAPNKPVEAPKVQPKVEVPLKQEPKKPDFKPLPNFKATLKFAPSKPVTTEAEVTETTSETEEPAF